MRIPTTFITASFASAAFLLGCLSVPWCDFATLTSTVVDSSGSLILETRLGLGLWRYQTFTLRNGGLYIENSCSGYDDDLVEVDSAWKASRAFGIMALVIGGVNLLYLYWQVCCCYRSKDGSNVGGATTQASILGGIFIVASFYQGLTLFFLRSSICTGGGGNKFQQQLGLSLQPAEVIYDERCALSTGANMGIASTICWFVAGVVACTTNPQKECDTSQPNDALENVAKDVPINDQEVIHIHDAEEPVDSADTADHIICEEMKGGEQDDLQD